MGFETKERYLPKTLRHTPLIRLSSTRELIAAIAFFSILFALLVWRSFRGLDWTDESFYALEAYRLTLGDHLFQSIWNATQLSAMLYSPIVAIYTSLTGGTTGIILFLRIVFLIILFAIAILFYCAVRKKAGTLWALLAVIPIFFFSQPLTFSYNTIHMAAFFAACGFLFAAGQTTQEKRRATLMTLAGAACGTAFICYPPTIMALPLFCVWILFEPSLGNSAREKACHFGFFALGGLLCIIALIVFISVNSSFDALFHYMRDLRSGSKKSRSLVDYALSLYGVYGRTSTLATIAACAFGFSSTFVKNEKAKTALRAIAFLGAASVIAWQCYRASGNFGIASIQQNVLFAMTINGLAVLSVNRFRWDSSLWMFLTGIIISIAVYYGTSNSAPYYAYPTALSVSAILLYIGNTSENWLSSANGRRAIAAVSSAFLAIACAFCFFYVYRDAPLQDLDTQIDSGPGAGLYTTKERVEQNQALLDAIDRYAPSDGNVLFVRLLPYGYLCTNSLPAVWHTWTIDLDDERFVTYYRENPSKLPDTIFFPSKVYESRNDGYTLGEFFEQYFKEHKHTIVETKAATVVLFGSEQ